jgi:small-conductance mechanosensitive channel
MREQVFDTKGRLLLERDTRTLAQAREAAIQQLRNQATAWIEAHLDPFDQINAALGVLPETEAAAVKDRIGKARERYQTLKAAVLAAANNTAADAVRWSSPA